MLPTPPPAPRTVTAFVTLTVAGRPLPVEWAVPVGPAPLRGMLPAAHALADQLVEAGLAALRGAGREISCKKGCGACCRQLVPVAAAEARALAELVELMPEPRRALVRARFADARRRLEQAGLWDVLMDAQNMDARTLTGLGLKYFALRIACPFLEDESCSIYPDRPAVCREYLVTSPAENCARPSADTIDVVPMPGKVSRALRAFDLDPAKTFVNWVPLSVAPAWAPLHPEPSEARTGPEMLKHFFELLLKKTVSVPDLPATGPGPAHGDRAGVMT